MKKEMNWNLGIRVDFAVCMAAGKVIVERDLFVGIKKDRIAFVGPYKPALKKRSKTFLEKKNHCLLPGFVNGHAHLPMSLLRGVADDVPLKTWLFEKIFPLEAKYVNKKFVTTGVSLSALECIRFGVTTVNEM